MTQKISSTSVVPDVATARKVYEKPEIEVIDLGYQPKLLVNSPPHRDDTDPDW